MTKNYDADAEERTSALPIFDFVLAGKTWTLHPEVGVSVISKLDQSRTADDLVAVLGAMIREPGFVEHVLDPSSPVVGIKTLRSVLDDAIAYYAGDEEGN